jgi:2-methylcitrate dehydratase PrpD
MGSFSMVSAEHRRASDPPVQSGPSLHPEPRVTFAAPTSPSGECDLIDALLGLAYDVDADAIPSTTLDAVRVLLTDALAVGLAGRLGAGIAELLATFAARGPARVLGQPRADRREVGAAAICNTALIHALEFDPVADAWLLHPLAGCLPAALALADERPGVTGRRFLTALAVGTEVACRIARAATTAPTFYRPGAMSTFAAVAAAVHLLRLDRVTARHAVGISFSLDGGTSYQAHEEGAAIHGMLPGFGVRAALEATRLARVGIAGPARVLEGNNGYFRLFEGGHWDRDRALDRLGETWLVEQVSLKPYPTGRLSHGAIAGVLELRERLGLTADRVRRLEIRASRHVVARTGRRPGPGDGALHQRLSIPFSVAQALHVGRVGLRQFGEGAAADPALCAIMGRVEVGVDPNLPPQTVSPVRLRLELTDGSVEEHEVEALPGSPGLPLTAARRRAKAADCWESSGSPSWWSPERLEEAVAGLAAAPDLEALWRVLAPG